MTLASSRLGVLRTPSHAHTYGSGLQQTWCLNNLYMLPNMTLTSSRLGVSGHLHMFSSRTLASSMLGVLAHLYMLQRMALASSRLGI